MIDQEKLSAITDRLNGVAADTAPSAPVEASAPSAASEDVKTEAPEGNESSSAPSAASNSEVKESAPETGQRVPYNRFKNVLDARNRFRSDAMRFEKQSSDYAAKLAELQKQVDQFRSAPAPAPVQQARPVDSVVENKSETSWIDDILGNDKSESTSATDDWRKTVESQYETMNKRMYEYEVNNAQRDLEKEIAGVVRKYPDFRPQDLAQAVINDPSINLMQAAEQFMTYKASIEEAAIDRYLRNNPNLTRKQAEQVVQSEMAQPPAAAPRPSGSRTSASTDVSLSTAADRPKTLKEAKHALQKFLHSNLR